MIIFKYPIDIELSFSIEMPLGARVLKVDMQKGSPYIWVICDPSVRKVARWFSVVGTGQEIPDECPYYIGTFQMAEGRLVWHLFEVGEKSSERSR